MPRATAPERASHGKKPPALKGELGGETPPLALAAIGLESELTLFVDGAEAKPEKVFGDPTAFIRSPLVHRQGTSYHLPTGGAIYFDTGVVEIATPVIEIARGCAARAGRSLWESILFVRDELDAWERARRRAVRLAGYSTHYNISFEDGRDSRGRRTSIEDLACLLVHLLPVPVMLLAANPRSTGVGVRPRQGRIELTADFTPSPALMIATATLVTGVARAVMAWPSYAVAELERRRLPVIEGFRPIPHTTRRGWLARAECYPRDPFATPVGLAVWPVRGGGEPRSLRGIGGAVYAAFRPAVRRIADPFTARLLDELLLHGAPLLLELPDRPAAYDHVGRLCFWDDLFPESVLSRSLYERILIRAIAGVPLRINGRDYRPVGMRGWSEVVFERLPERSRHRISIDFLVQHLDRWERAGRGGRLSSRRRPRSRHPSSPAPAAR